VVKLFINDSNAAPRLCSSSEAQKAAIKKALKDTGVIE
jgi:hypothetical protein